MLIKTWLLFVVVSIMPAISPGPAVLLAISNSLRYGAKATLYSALGNAFGLTLLAFAVANQGVALDSLDRVLSAELARVAASGVSDSELVKARNIYRASVITGRQTPLAVAEALQSANHFLGSADAANTDFARHMAVTAADIRRVAAEYLRPENALTLLVSAEAAK